MIVFYSARTFYKYDVQFDKHNIINIAFFLEKLLITCVVKITFCITITSCVRVKMNIK